MWKTLIEVIHIDTKVCSSLIQRKTNLKAALEYALIRPWTETMCIRITHHQFSFAFGDLNFAGSRFRRMQYLDEGGATKLKALAPSTADLLKRNEEMFLFAREGTMVVYKPSSLPLNTPMAHDGYQMWLPMVSSMVYGQDPRNSHAIRKKMHVRLPIADPRRTILPTLFYDTSSSKHHRTANGVAYHRGFGAHCKLGFVFEHIR